MSGSCHMKVDFTTQKTHLSIAPFYDIYLYILNKEGVFRGFIADPCFCVFGAISSIKSLIIETLTKTRTLCFFVFFCVVKSEEAA